MFGLIVVLFVFSNEQIIPASALSFPRYVWTYFDGSMYDELKTMYNLTYQTLCQSWTLYLVSESNISLFLDPNTFPRCFPSLTAANKADYIRLRLLSKYGGWWIDSATIISSPNLLDTYLDEVRRTRSHLFGYCNLDCPRHYIEVGFLYAPLGSAVIKQWLVESELMHRSGKANYIYNTYRNGLTFPSQVFPSYPTVSVYMAIYVAEHMVLHRLLPRHLPIVTKDAANTFYKWRYDCLHKMNCMKRRVMLELTNSTYPVMKVNAWIRRVTIPNDHTVPGRLSIDCCSLNVGQPIGFCNMLFLSSSTISYTIGFLLIIDFIWQFGK